MHPLLNKKAPRFSLPDQDGKIHSLPDYAGQHVLLYFYPKDMTPGCTVEAEGFRDAMAAFKKAKVVVLGVSADTVASHKKFCDKHKLNFPLLSDESKKTIEKYGAWVEKSMYGKKYMGIQRDSFLISPEGKVVRYFPKVTPEDHPMEVLEAVRQAQ